MHVRRVTAVKRPRCSCPPALLPPPVLPRPYDPIPPCVLTAYPPSPQFDFPATMAKPTHELQCRHVRSPPLLFCGL